MRLMKTVTYLMFVFFLTLFLSCGGSESGSSEGIGSAEVQNTEERLVKLNRSYKNTITRGEEIFNTVMAKYQPVIDFYGADSTVFQDMVNTALSSSDTFASAAEKMYCYDSLAKWEDAEFVVEFEDGSKETMTKEELEAQIKSNASEGAGNLKKISKILTPLKYANKITEKIVNFSNWAQGGLNKPLTNISLVDNFLHDGIEALQPILDNKDQLMQVSNTLVTIGKCAGYIGVAINIGEALGLFDTGPSPDYIINQKLDYIIDMLDVMYDHLEYIEDKLDHIENVVVQQANQELQLNIQMLKNTINGKIQEINIATSIETKREIATALIGEINGYIENFIAGSTVDYTNYTNYLIAQSHDPEYSPLEVTINMPHERWVVGRIECRLTRFYMTNPTSEMPFAFEAFDYLKSLILTRMSINSFIEEGELLEQYNSNTALLYINNESIHLGKLRKRINEIYGGLKTELKTTIENINGNPSENNSVKENHAYIIGEVDRHFEWSGFHHTDWDIGPGEWGSEDVFEHTPWFSSVPDVYCNEFDENDWDRIHSFPYDPNIQLGSNDPVEFKKSMTDPAFLDDAVKTLDLWYKAKSNKLLEFAASLAALEVHLASHLSDEAYETYKGN